MKTATQETIEEKQEPKKILDRVNIPADIKSLSDDEIKILADDVRNHVVDSVSKTGGHLGAGLGVVELTTAIHAVFDTPTDKLIWDVGHQCYPHKVLTGRKNQMDTIRKGDGLSGFTKRKESQYDDFGAGHSSTSISAGLGMAVGRDLKNNDNHVIAVIGDGSISAGMAYEAMNNAGDLNSKMLVILNDNDMSIAPPTGAMSRYLTNLVSGKHYNNVRELAKKATSILPEPLQRAAAKAEETARNALGGGTLFEEMGFYYIGPVDGHNMDHLLPILRNIRDSDQDKPILLHVVTPDDKIVGITAAMPGGTGMDVFGATYPDRMFDVGIAEQHAVTFAAGLATEGLKPFCALYSTFLQRGYDQVVHDVCIQNLPVKFMIDRAGLVGADGSTHAGAFDTAYLGCLPNMMLMAASDESELARMVVTANDYDAGPCALRFPRGNGYGVDIPENPTAIEVGKGRVVREGKDVAILSYGTRLQECLTAADMLKDKNINITVADARFAKPLDNELITQLATQHSALITIEEGSIGGFGSFVLEFLSAEGLLDNDLKVRTMHLPDIFQDQDAPDKQYAQAGLDANAIVEKILSLKL